jgi:hypothetical protein
MALLPEVWVERNTNEFNSAAEAITRHPGGLARTFGFAFLAHLLDLACLNLLFLAFGQPVGVGVLVAGYAMAILFWIVSITPQGIGVVEGVMVLVFTSLGVPAEVATTVSLAFRGLTFWLPLALGFILLRRVSSFGASKQSLAQNWGVRIVAILTVIMGLVNLLSSVTPSLMACPAVGGISPLQVRRGGTDRRPRRVCLAPVGERSLAAEAGGLAASLVVLLISDDQPPAQRPDYEEALLAVGCLAWLLALRAVHARSDPPSIRQGIDHFGGSCLPGLWCQPVLPVGLPFSVNFGLGAALRQTIVMFTQFYSRPGANYRFGRYLPDSIYRWGSDTRVCATLINPACARPAACYQGGAATRSVHRRILRSLFPSALDFAG